MASRCAQALVQQHTEAPPLPELYPDWTPSSGHSEDSWPHVEDAVPETIDWQCATKRTYQPSTIVRKRRFKLVVTQEF